MAPKSFPPHLNSSRSCITSFTHASTRIRWKRLCEFSKYIVCEGKRSILWSLIFFPATCIRHSGNINGNRVSTKIFRIIIMDDSAHLAAAAVVVVVAASYTFQCIYYYVINHFLFFSPQTSRGAVKNYNNFNGFCE